MGVNYGISFPFKLKGWDLNPFGTGEETKSLLLPPPSSPAGAPEGEAQEQQGRVQLEGGWKEDSPQFSNSGCGRMHYPMARLDSYFKTREGNPA